VTEFPVPNSTWKTLGGEIAALGSEIVFDENEPSELGTLSPSASPGEAPLEQLPSHAAVESSLKGEFAQVLTAGEGAFRRRERTFTLELSPPERGTATITWQAAPETKRGRARKSPIIVATAEQSFNLAEPEPLRVNLTSAGARLFGAHRKRKPERLSVVATFDGMWSGPFELDATQTIPD
jgi:hypothetical protein